MELGWNDAGRPRRGQLQQLPGRFQLSSNWGVCRLRRRFRHLLGQEIAPEVFFALATAHGRETLNDLSAIY